MVKAPLILMLGAWVPPLVRELRSHMPEVPLGATHTQKASRKGAFLCMEAAPVGGGATFLLYHSFVVVVLNNSLYVYTKQYKMRQFLKG